MLSNAPIVTLADTINHIQLVTSYKPILYDHWKNGNGWKEVVDANGNSTDPNGSAVEYNGLRIVKKSETGTMGSTETIL